MMKSVLYALLALPFIIGCGLPEENLQSDLMPGTYELMPGAEDVQINPQVEAVLGPTNPADCNFDGDVDGDDLAIWQQNFGAKNATQSECDIDGDSAVTGRDFLVWQRNVGR